MTFRPLFVEHTPAALESLRSLPSLVPAGSTALGILMAVLCTFFGWEEAGALGYIDACSRDAT